MIVQVLADRLERIEATIARPTHFPGSASVAAEPAASASHRLVSTMERIAYALQVIARVRRPDAPGTPKDGAGSFTSVCDGLTDEHLDRGQVEGRATENVGHSLASLAAQLDELGQLVRKQERSARALDKQHCTVDETAELTGYKPWTIRQACHKGRIKGRKGDDGRWRVPRQEVQRIQDAGLPKD